MRAGYWLFRRTVLSVTFSAPIAPSGSDWNAAIELRDLARAEVLRLCGEPDLGEEVVYPLKPSSSGADPT